MNQRDDGIEKTLTGMEEQAGAVPNADEERDTSDGEDPDIYYHPAFCAAMRQELVKDLDGLVCTDEYNLNSMPNRSDLLVEKKDASAMLDSGLAKIFRKYNLMEYKSPGKPLGIASYHLNLAYAHLLAAYRNNVSFPEEITISFVREGKPEKLMCQFEEMGFGMDSPEEGIYHYRREKCPDMQVIVTRELPKEYVWIRSLTPHCTMEDMSYMAKRMEEFDDRESRMRISTILDLVLRLNRNKEWMKEMKGMGALRDLFKDEFEEKDKKIEELSAQLESKDAQLESKDAQLESKDAQLESKDAQLESKDAQLESQNAQLKNEKAENSRLRQEIEQLRKQLGKIAVL